MDMQKTIPDSRTPVRICEKDGWNLQFRNGFLTAVQVYIAGEMYPLPLRTDEYAPGFLWNGQKIDLTPDPASGLCTGVTPDGLHLAAGVSVREGRLCLYLSVRNPTAETRPVDRGSFRLGLDTFLDQYPDYLDSMVTTLLRCEKTHLWGYFQSPNGRILTICSDAPVASYSMDYEPGIYAHHIYTATLDLFQSGKLPDRHPQHLHELHAGEKKEWHFYLEAVDTVGDIERIKPMLAAHTTLPMLASDRWTLGKGETTTVTLYSSAPPVSVLMTAPDGHAIPLAAQAAGNGVYTLDWLADGEPGLYQLDVENAAGYRAQAIFSIRMPYSWYMQQARKAAYDIKQGAQLWFEDGNSTECWFGVYAGYLAERYWPDADYLRYFDQRVDTIYNACYNRDLNTPFDDKIHFGERITNQETLTNMLLLRYRATGDFSSLEQAAVLLDYILGQRCRADGAIAGYGYADYTSVLYPAKLCLDFAETEEEMLRTTTLTPSQKQLWTDRMHRHRAAADKTLRRLATLGSHFETEGTQTFEDGVHACSATQLSQYALIFPEGSPERQYFLEEAIRVNDGHTSHQQAIIPDARINGGTLRYWETPEIKLYSNAMNSPHGWSGWILYALYNLYELTGDKRYLQRAVNAMGSDIQLIGFDGVLRWCFTPDPHREVELYVPDETKPVSRTPDDFYYSPDDEHRSYFEGKHIPYTIAEEYLPHIGYWYPGWSGQTPHEIFKAMAEHALTKCYVHENPDGTLEAYNAHAERKDGCILVTPAEDLVSEASICLQQTADVLVTFYNGTMRQTMPAGLPHWMKTDENRPLCRIHTAPMENGTVEPSASAGHTGDRITLTVRPAPGFRLQTDSLCVNGQKTPEDFFHLGTEDMRLTASFVPASSDVIASVQPVAVSMEAGDMPALPAAVTVCYTDGGCARMPAVWEALPAADCVIGGVRTVSGHLADGTTCTAQLTIHEKQSHILRIEDLHAVTAAGQKPVLPAYAVVVYNDGGLDADNQSCCGSTALRRVQWGRIPTARCPDSMDITGSVEGTDLQAVCHVTVLGAYAHPVVRFRAEAKRISIGETPVLPEQVTGWTADGKEISCPVVWDAVPAYAAERRGLWVVRGHVANTPVQPCLTLIFS